MRAPLSPARLKANQRPMAQFTSGGLSLAYDDIGQRGGPPIVLLHGFASNRNEMWRRLGWYGAFERKGMRVIAPDLRGHGESAKPHEPEAYDRAAMIGDVFALMDHLQISRADLMGYSMGARLALAAAFSHPERIDHLILGGVGARMFERSGGAGMLADAMLAEDAATISEPLLRSFRQFADGQGEDRAALAACVRGGGQALTPERVSQLRVPTLIVAGSRDALAGSAEELARAIPGGQAVTLPGCDHFSAIPHALFKASVFDFLEGTLGL
jgi:pimeloyl-ACP methyl ester carboxylesterase